MRPVSNSHDAQFSEHSGRVIAPMGTRGLGSQQRGGAISPLGRRCPGFVAGGSCRLRQRVRRPPVTLACSRVLCRCSSNCRGLWATLSSSPSWFSSSDSAGQADSSSSTTSPLGRHTPTAAALRNAIKANSQQKAVRRKVVRSDSSFDIGSTRPCRTLPVFSDEPGDDARFGSISRQFEFSAVCVPIL